MDDITDKHQTYAEVVSLLDIIATYSGYMAKSHNADEFQRNFVKYDDGRQTLLKLIKGLINDSEQDSD